MTTWSDVESYQSQGFLTSAQVLPDDEAQVFRQRFDDLVSDDGIDEHKPGFRLHDRHLDKDFVWDVVNRAAALPAIAEILGPDPIVLGTRFICKPPFSGLSVPWHRDITYAGLHPPVQVNAWMAVDDADLGNGCLQLLPLTAEAGHGHAHRPVRDALALGDQQLDIGEAELHALVAAPLRSGHAVVFDGRVIHGSAPATVAQRRCGLAIRFAPGHVRLLNAGQWAAVPVRADSPLIDGSLILSREQARHFAYQPVTKFGPADAS